MPDMKTLTVNGTTYIVVDADARTDISSLTERQEELTEAVNDKVSKADYAPVTATTGMTQPVGVDASGKLFTTPGSTGTGGGITDASLNVSDDGAGNVTLTINTVG